MHFDALQLAGWIAILFFVTAGVNQVMRLTDRLKPQPPTSELSANGRELSQRVGRLETEAEQAIDRRRAIYTKMEASEKAAQGRSDILSADLHNRITCLATEMAGLLKAVEMQGQHLGSLDAKLDRWMELQMECRR